MASDPPPEIREYAEQVVAYVRRALGITLEYDSDTLPVLDHYLRTVPADEPAQRATLDLVVATGAAYFGEVVRRHLGGRWELGVPDGAVDAEASPGRVGERWRVVLPTGVSFAPAGFVAAAISRDEPGELDAGLDAPARMRAHVQEALERMGAVSADEYYSLCGRLDTLEHVHEVLVGVAARILGDADPQGDEADGPGEADAPAGPADAAGAVLGGAAGPGGADDTRVN